MTKEKTGILSKLKYPAAAGTFHHARLAPPEELAHVVLNFWIVRWDLGGGPPQTSETLPHPNVHLVFEANTCCIHGVLTGRFKRVLERSGCVVGVKFRAGAFHGFFHESVSTLRNRSIDGIRVFGSEVGLVAEEVLSQPDDASMTAPAARFLLERLPSTDSDASLAASIVEAIESDRTLIRIDQLLDRWALSKRSLQRLFEEYVGVGPKWVINRYRMHEALERVDQGGQANWAELALELGYFDQAHFIRDFKALVGCTPARYAGMYRPEQQPDR